MTHRKAGPQWLAIVPVLILIVAAAGCSSLLDTTEELPDNARVFVTGTSPVPLELILSNEFTAIENNEGKFDVTPVVADTFTITPPFERNHPIKQTGRIFVRLTQADSTVEASIRLRVLLDSKEVYNTQAMLRNASLEYLFVTF